MEKFDPASTADGPIAPVGTVDLYDLHTTERDAQWVLLTGYREQDDRRQSRSIVMSDQRGASAFGTLLRITLPEDVVRRHRVRDPAAPAGTYQIPAGTINHLGRIWVARSGADLPEALRREAPRAMHEPASDWQAGFLDQTYDAFRSRHPTTDNGLVLPAMGSRLVLHAFQDLVGLAMDAEMPRSQWLEAEQRLDGRDDEEDGLDDDADANEFDEDEDINPEERVGVDWLGYHRRDRFEAALSLVKNPVGSANWGRAVHAFSTIESASPAARRLGLFLGWFCLALTQQSVEAGESAGERG